MEEPESICAGRRGHLAWQCLGMLCRGVPSIPSPQCCPSTAELLTPAAELGTSHASPGSPSHRHGPSTHNVRSLGMWLKLDTGMEVILLLFRVLQEGRGGQVRVAVNGSMKWSRCHQAPGSNSTHPPPSTGWTDGEARDGDSPNHQAGLPFPGFSPPQPAAGRWTLWGRIRPWSTAPQERYQTLAWPLLGARERQHAGDVPPAPR